MSSTIRNLDLNLLKVFDAIYETASVSGAARRLNMSQPAVSRRLGGLRDHFDDPLFERAGNGVVPTPKAEAILGSVRQALSLIDNTITKEEKFDPAQHVRHFRLILPDPAEFRVMPFLINRLPEGSAVTFECLAFSNIDITQAFSEDKVDAAVTLFLPEASDIAYRTIYSDSGALISRRDHPSLKDGFNLMEIDKLSFISLPNHLHRLTRLDETLVTLGLKRRVVCTTHKISAIPHIVATTDLVSFLPLDFAQSLGEQWNVDVLPLPTAGVVGQKVYLAHAKSTSDDSSVQWLCDEIEAVYADHS